jgi:hypothetical protein
MNTDQLIVTRCQRLACLGLEGTPADDTIEAAAKLWVEILGDRDANALRVAFDTIEATATRWPVPAQIIAALPTYREPYRVPAERRIHDESSQERIRKLVEACAQRLRLPKPTN